MGISNNNTNIETLTLQGDLVLSNAAQSQEEILQALRQCRQLNVLLRDVTALDMSFVQLLYGLHQASKMYGKPVTFDVALPEPVAELLRKSGFSMLIQSFQSK